MVQSLPPDDAAKARTLKELRVRAAHQPSPLHRGPRDDTSSAGPRSYVIMAAAVSAMLVTVLLAGCALPFGHVPSSVPTLGPITPQPDKPTVIQHENARAGSADWLVKPAQRATTEIQAYASAVSVQPGDRLTFYVSVQVDGTPYTAEIFRLGWYHGLGARLMLTSQQVGHAQGYYDQLNSQLVDCHTCIYDRETGMVEAGWRPSLIIDIPASWVTGVYLAKFTDANGMQTYLTFDVRGNPTSTYMVVTPDTTTQAYNTWGGRSLYIGPPGANRADVVSFNRPIVSLGSFPWQYNVHVAYDQGLPTFIDAVRWMERQGYDLSYMSSVDLDQHPELLRDHRVYISIGHDEYWSKAMRDGVEQARDTGISLLFLGANTAYWQIRFEPDRDGVPDRHIICYKSAQADPLTGKDDSQVTVEWRDPPVSRPENALVGIMYVGFEHSGSGYPWELSPDASGPILDGTGLVPNRPYGCDLVGYEWDRVVDNGFTPAGLQIIGKSPTAADGSDYSSTTYYIAHSGALVFATGSIYWAHALDSMRIGPVNGCTHPDTVIPGMQRLLANVMAAAASR